MSCNVDSNRTSHKGSMLSTLDNNRTLVIRGLMLSAVDSSRTHSLGIGCYVL